MAVADLPAKNNNNNRNKNEVSSSLAASPSASRLVFLIVVWYVGNTLHNVYNKKATNMIDANGFVACAVLGIGLASSAILWGTGMRKVPNLSSSDIALCIPLGLCACFAHTGSVFSSSIGAVSFAQIVKSSEPVFAAMIGVLVPPMDIKPLVTYLFLIPIVGGVGLACVKDGKGVDSNTAALMYALVANVAAALKGKLGADVTKELQSHPKKHMDSANVYAVTNIIAFLFTVPFVVSQELPTLDVEWRTAVETYGLQPLVINIGLSGLFFYVYNEFAFAFTATVGAVTSSVLNTAKRVIIIAVSALVFDEPMERNTVVGSAIAIGGTFGYSLSSSSSAQIKKKE